MQSQGNLGLGSFGVGGLVGVGGPDGRQVGPPGWQLRVVELRRGWVGRKVGCGGLFDVRGAAASVNKVDRGICMRARWGREDRVVVWLGWVMKVVGGGDPGG